MTEFRTSSYCTVNGCVEVGMRADGAAAMRDSKDRARTVTQEFSAQGWSDFLASAKRGEFDQR